MEIILSKHKLDGLPEAFTEACEHIAKFLNTVKDTGRDLFINSASPEMVTVCAWKTGSVPQKADVKIWTPSVIAQLNKELKGCTVAMIPPFVMGITIKLKAADLPKVEDKSAIPDK